MLRQYGNWPFRYKLQLSTTPGYWFDAYDGSTVTLWGARRLARRQLKRITDGPVVWRSEEVR